MKVKFLFFSMIILLLCFAFKPNSEKPISNEDRKLLNNASGEQLFKSIVLKNGSLTDKIPFIQNNHLALSNKETEMIENYQSSLIEFLEKKNSTYFLDLKKEFSSKDVKRVSDYLLYTADLMIQFSQINQEKFPIVKNAKSVVPVQAMVMVDPPPPPPFQLISILVAYSQQNLLKNLSNNSLAAQDFAVSIANSF